MKIVVLITSKDKKEAEILAKGLLKKRLCACVNIVGKINSSFWWQGKIDKCSESLLIVKTKKSLLAKLIKEVKKLHSYTVPEIIALPIIGGNKDYLNWLSQETK